LRFELCASGDLKGTLFALSLIALSYPVYLFLVTSSQGLIEHDIVTVG